MKVGVETQTQPRPQASPAQCLAAQGLPASPPFLPQGTVLCDIILLNFLKGADQYKAKKFEEVSGAQERQRDRAGRATGPQGLSAAPGAHLPGASEGKFTGPQCILGVPTRGCLAKSGLCEDHGGSVGGRCCHPNHSSSPLHFWGRTNPAMGWLWVLSTLEMPGWTPGITQTRCSSPKTRLRAPTAESVQWGPCP